MKNEHAGAIKGLSIAVVVLSAIGIIGAILIMVFSGLLSAVLLENGPEIAYHLEFNDNGTAVAVGPGDSTVTRSGECHSIRNTGDTPLELLAVIATL